MNTTQLDIRLRRYGLTVLRVTLGAVFLAHGAQKLFSFGLEGVTGAMAQMGLPFPALSAALITSVELVGGAALIVGALTRFAALSLAVAMLVATLAVHLPNGFFAPNGIEFTLTLLAGSIGLVLAGPGAFALDNRIWRSGDVAAVVKLVQKERPQVRAAA